MKKLVVLFCAVGFTLGTTAQIKTPQPSPSAKLEQKVGLTDITVVYSRPSMKGRTIFGNLVPFDKMWRTGANANTIVTFGDDVKIGGKDLPKGDYALYTKPGQDSWDVIFYKNTENWGTPKEWKDSEVALETTVTPVKSPMTIETFTIMFSDLTNNDAHMNLIWENTIAPIKIEVPTQKIASESIDTAMKGLSGNDYYAAASYYLDEKKDLDKALTWIDKAVELRGDDAFWILRKKSLIEAELGKKKDAISTAKKSLAAAEKAGNADYVKLNKDSLKEWGVK